MKVQSLLATTLCGILLFSCNSKEEGTDTVVEGKPVEVSIVVESGAKTRANIQGTEEESAVNKIEFYVFDSKGDIDPKVGSGTGYVAGTASDMTTRLIVSSGANKKFVTVINSNIGAVADYDELKSKMAKQIFTADLLKMDHNAREEVKGAFEMTGEVQETVPDKSTNVIVRISVDRVVSRVDAPIYEQDNGDDTGVILDAEQIKDLWGKDAAGINPADISFVPLGYTVINGLSHSDMFVQANSTTWWNDKNHLNSSFTTPSPGFYTNTYSGKGVAADWFLSGDKAHNEHRVYVYENHPKVLNDGWDALSVYAIMLKGELVVDGQPTLTKERYWRVNLTRTDNYSVERNAIYEVYVQNIVTIGHETPEEGEKEPPVIPPADQSQVEVRITVNNWTLKEYKTQV